MDTVLLEVPGGRIEEGETPAESARRELREECGLNCTGLKEVAELLPAPYITNEVLHVFVASGLVHTQGTRDRSEDGLRVRRVLISEVVEILKNENRIPPVDGFILLKFLQSYSQEKS